MMAVDHYMAWNMAGYFKLVHGDWEDAERMSSPRVHKHSRPKIFKHRPREWQLEQFGPGVKLVPYDLRPVDPRMSAEERSWAIWDGRESARPYRIAGSRGGTANKWKRGHRGKLTTYAEWLEERSKKEED
jgi:hypothetical protein